MSEEALEELDGILSRAETGAVMAGQMGLEVSELSRLTELLKLMMQDKD